MTPECLLAAAFLATPLALCLLGLLMAYQL